MSREKQLIKNTLILAFGKLGTQVINFLLLPLYTVKLSTAEYGTFDIINTLILILVPVCFFQMDQGVFRFLIENRGKEEKQKKIITTVVLTFAIQSIVYILFGSFISFFIDNEYKYYLIANVVSLGLAHIMLQITRGLGDNSVYSKASILSGITTATLSILFIFSFNLGAIGLIISSFIANIVIATYIFGVKKVHKEIVPSEYDWKQMKEIWKYSIPMIPNQLSWWIVMFSDRIIITTMCGVSANGIYSVANKFSNMCASLFSIFNMSWTETVVLHIEDNDKSEYLTKIFNQAMKVCVAICFLIIAIMPFSFGYLVIEESYSGAYMQIPILMIATIFNVAVSLLGGIYVAMKKSKEVAKTSLLSAIINIVITIMFVKSIGIYAASISTLISYFVMCIYRYIDVKKYVILKIDWNLIISASLIGALLLTTYYIGNILYSAILLMISCAYAFWSVKAINKAIINKFMKKIKK